MVDNNDKNYDRLLDQIKQYLEVTRQCEQHKMIIECTWEELKLYLSENKQTGLFIKQMNIDKPELIKWDIGLVTNMTRPDDRPTAKAGIKNMEKYLREYTSAFTKKGELEIEFFTELAKNGKWGSGNKRLQSVIESWEADPKKKVRYSKE